MWDLTGQVAVVTGGAGEIGAAVVSTLAQLGATVHFCDIDTSAGARLSEELTAIGHTVRFSDVDATDYAQVQRWVDSVVGLPGGGGGLEIAVNTVGWTANHPFVDDTPEYWQKILSVNLMSAVHLTHAAVPHMLERGYGRVILISSLAGRIGRRGRALYSASKAGVIGFVRATALELADQEITVNTVAPGTTETAQMRFQGEEATRFALAGIPRGKIAAPRDQACAVAFLASAGAGHITGQTLAVDGGATMV